MTCCGWVGFYLFVFFLNVLFILIHFIQDPTKTNCEKSGSQVIQQNKSNYTESAANNNLAENCSDLYTSINVVALVLYQLWKVTVEQNDKREYFGKKAFGIEVEAVLTSKPSHSRSVAKRRERDSRECCFWEATKPVGGSPSFLMSRGFRKGPVWNFLNKMGPGWSHVMAVLSTWIYTCCFSYPDTDRMLGTGVIGAFMRPRWLNYFSP